MKRWILAVLVALSRGRLRLRVPDAADALFLTFDDGPDPVHTPALLEVLRRHGARATFFLVGRRLRAHPQLARELLDAGHALGNHSDSHSSFDELPWDRQRQEIEAVEGELRALDGTDNHWFRPPRGRLSVGCLWGVFLGTVRVQLWTMDSNDFKADAATVRDRLLAAPLRGGDVILFHDDGPAAAQALDELLPRWRQRGFRFPAMQPPGRQPRQDAVAP